MKIYEDEKMEVAKGFKDWAEEERAAGKSEQAQATAIRMAKKGNSVEEIAEIVNFDVEVVKTWLNR